MGFLDCKVSQRMARSSLKAEESHVRARSRICMQNRLWEKSYADDYDARSCGRKTLPSVSSHPIK
jgi:hypothetical protein